MISDIKLFDKWSFDGLIVSDIDLARYIKGKIERARK